MDGRRWENEKIDCSIRKNILPGMPEYVENYYMWLVAQNIQPMSRRCYLRIVRRYLEWINKDVKAIDISKTADKAVNYQAYSATTESGEPARISTRKTVFYALRNFYDYLHEAGLIGQVSIGKVPCGYEKIERIRVTSEQLDDVIEATDTGVGNGRRKAYNEPWKSRDKAILALLVCTGMRESALCNLDIDNIDFEAEVIEFIDKGAKSHTFIISAAIPIIKDWLGDRERLIGEHQLSEHDINALFITNRRQRITANTVSNVTKRYSREALGIELTPHKFRAAFITLLYDKTHDIELVRDVVGHASYGTTARYLPQSMKNKRVAANILRQSIKL